MYNQELSRQIQRLNDLIKKTNDACGDNLELRADWARYICILSAGLIENSLKAIYTDYANKAASGPIASFVGKALTKILNPKFEKFSDIAATFKKDWKEELETYASIDGRADALNSIMNNRHLIAHGKSHQSNISLIQIKTYLEPISKP